MTTYQEIADAADDEMASLQELERTIDAQIRRIKDKEWTAPLTPQERSDLQQLREAMAALLGTMEELSYVTVGALDKTDEVRRLAHAIAGSRNTLEGELRDIQHIAAVATRIASIAGGLTQIEGKLGSVLNG